MPAELKKVECDPMCGFMVRSYDEKELVEIVTQHVKKFHNKKISEKEAKESIKPV
jgi:predicted small metal-binding protein